MVKNASLPIWAMASKTLKFMAIKESDKPFGFEASGDAILTDRRTFFEAVEADYMRSFPEEAGQVRQTLRQGIQQ